MKNIEKYGNNIMNEDDGSIACGVRRLKGHNECAGIKCTDCNMDALKWLIAECKEPVLDEVERKYLSDVIRPFRKEVATISKFNAFDGSQYIYIEMKDRRGSNLPTFQKGTMYKGMILGTHYSLEELGL